MFLPLRRVPSAAAGASWLKEFQASTLELIDDSVDDRTGIGDGDSCIGAGG